MFGRYQVFDEDGMFHICSHCGKKSKGERVQDVSLEISGNYCTKCAVKLGLIK